MLKIGQPAEPEYPPNDGNPKMPLQTWDQIANIHTHKNIHAHDTSGFLLTQET